jgi:hypothetical protein
MFGFVRVKLRTATITGSAALLGVLAALFALGNSRVPIAGLLLCPVLLPIWPVFDNFAELGDTWLWAVTAFDNAVMYALLARIIVAYVRRRSRPRGPSVS